MHSNASHSFKNVLHLIDLAVNETKDEVLSQFFNYLLISALTGKKIAEKEGIQKHEFQINSLGFILARVTSQSTDPNLLATIVTEIKNKSLLSSEDINTVQAKMELYKEELKPNTKLEKLLLDSYTIHLGTQEGLEWMSILRKLMERKEGHIYSEIEWLQFMENYFISQPFLLTYTKKNYAELRSKNFAEIQKRVEKLNVPLKGIKDQDEHLSDREGENLFKIAFRNYLNLVAMADRKAHLLIQVNAILSSVIIGFTIKRMENTSYYILPTTLILLVAACTIFYSILASKPLEQIAGNKEESGSFFFGSFDRIDPQFAKVSWSSYDEDMHHLFKGSKETVLNQLIKESFQVRQALTKKFNYLSVAYKIFIIGQTLSITIFVLMMLFK